jgi:ABC-2 type transport system permease protein
VKPFNFFNFANISQSFRNKNFKYGGYATLLFLFMLAILVAVNLVAGLAPLKIDLSQNKLYSLSAQTVGMLKKLDREVTIYALYPAGRENKTIVEVLRKYHDNSKRVSLKLLDPDKNPGFVKKYAGAGETPAVGGIIVISGNNSKVIKESDLYNTYLNQQTMEKQIVSLAVEQRVTGAISYVTGNLSTPVLYQLQGHGEAELGSDAQKQLEMDNYSIKSVNLVTQPLPSEAAILMLNSPQQDLTAAEAEKVREFLAGQGRAIFLIDYTKTELPNLQSLLTSYGINIEHHIIVEGDNNRHVGNPLLLLPELESHPITKPLISNQMPVLVPVAQSIKLLDVKKRTVAITPLLSTSKQAWGKIDVNSLNQEKEANDPQGPFNIAVAVTDRPEAEKDESKGAKIVIVANARFISPEYTAQVPGNAGFLTNSLNWLHSRDVALSIQPKSLLSYRLNLNAFQILIYSGIVVILIPLALFITGLIVWMRRRHL